MLTATPFLWLEVDRGRELLQHERVGEREHHRDTDADQEGRVDQAGQQEHLGLQFVHQLGLTRGRFEVLAAHDADADAGADGTQTNDETGGQGDKTKNVFHGKTPSREKETWWWKEILREISACRGPGPRRPASAS